MIKRSAQVLKRKRVDPKTRKPCKPRRKLDNGQSEELESSDEDGNPGYEHLAKRTRRGGNNEERARYAAIRAKQGGGAQTSKGNDTIEHEGGMVSLHSRSFKC